MLAFDVYRHWETDLRPYVISALNRLTPQQLHTTPPGWDRNAWELAEHLVESEWRWIYRNALKRVPWTEQWQPGQFENLDQLLTAWQRIHAVTLEWLRETPVSELSRVYPMPDVNYPSATMNWIVYHVVEHEAHHRGQLYMLLRVFGLNPPEA